MRRRFLGDRLCHFEWSPVDRGHSLEKPILRVLIVDDFEPWRRFLRSTLQKLSQLRIIGEESDGLSALHSAEQLKPDLILLDIGLPKVNGIEAARRIRGVSPNSKILFASAYRSCASRLILYRLATTSAVSPITM